MKNKLSIWVLVAVIVLAGIVKCVNATNYYLDNYGDNGNTGLSAEQAWATLQYVINNSSPLLSAGDTLFIMGGTYSTAQHTDYGNFYTAGTSENPIVIKAYGDSTAVFTNLGGEIERWIHMDGANCEHIVWDGVGYVNDERYMLEFRYWDWGAEGGDRFIASAGRDYLSFIGLYMNGDDGDSTNTIRGGFVDLHDCDHITLSRCKITYGTIATGYYGGDSTAYNQGDPDLIGLWNCDYAKVDSCVLYGGNHGICNFAGCHYGQFTDNYIPFNWGGGLFLQTNTGDYGVGGVLDQTTHVLVEGNRIYNTGITTWFRKPSIQVSSQECVIRNNVFYNMHSARDDSLESWQIFSIEQQAALPPSNNNIYNNTIVGGGTQLEMQSRAGAACANNIIRNNIWYDNQGYLWPDGTNEFGPWVFFFMLGEATLDNDWISDCASPLEIIDLDGDWGGNYFNNNLIRHSPLATTDSMLYFMGPSACGSNNNFWDFGDLLSIAPNQWSGCIESAPSFSADSPVGSPTWWYLDSESPCIDAGMVVQDTIGAYVESIAEGFGWDTLTWYGTAPDIGAYETGAAADEGDTCCEVSTLSFGNVYIDSTAVDSFYIYACGDSALVDSIHDWGLPANFTLMEDSSYTIAGGDTMWFTVQFIPTEAVSYADTFSPGHETCSDVVVSGAGMALSLPATVRSSTRRRCGA